jgi:hypothetical protein
MTTTIENTTQLGWETFISIHISHSRLPKRTVVKTIFTTGTTNLLLHQYRSKTKLEHTLHYIAEKAFRAGTIRPIGEFIQGQMFRPPCCVVHGSFKKYYSPHEYFTSVLRSYCGNAANNLPTNVHPWYLQFHAVILKYSTAYR